VQPAPQEILERRKQVSSLTAAINELPEDWRTALVLQTFGGQSSAAIAALLGVPAGTVRY
jgi:DNA-directed RNA polymerase specialized sigma24 family protein